MKKIINLIFAFVFILQGDLIASGFSKEREQEIIESMKERLGRPKNDSGVSKIPLTNYVLGFRTISENHRVKVGVEGHDYYTQHAISCCDQQKLVEKLKKDSRAHQVKLNWNNPDDSILIVLIGQFMQTSWEFDQADKVSKKYNEIRGFSKTDDRRIKSFESPLYKSACYDAKVYDRSWKQSHRTPADLIAVRQECHQKHHDFVQSLESKIAQAESDTYSI